MTLEADQHTLEELRARNERLVLAIEELRSANQVLTVLLSSSNMASLLLDREQRIRAFTPAAARFLNLNAKDTGRCVWEAAPAPACDGMKEDYGEALRALRPVKREILNAAGERRIRQVQPCASQDNDTEAAIVTFSEINGIDRPRRDHAIIAGIVESLEDAVIVMTLDGIVTNWNSAAETTYGHSAGDMVGRPQDRLFPISERAKLTRILEEVRAGRRVGPYETEGLRNDGTRVQLSVTVSPVVQTDGQVIAAFTLARDITERKRTEAELITTRQRLQAIMESLPVGVVFANDIECRSIEVNRALLTLCGARPGDQLPASADSPDSTGRRIRYFRDGRELSDYELPLQRAIVRQTPIAAQELEVQLSGGRRWWAEVSGVPVRGQHGEVVGGLAVVTDVTERKRTQEALIDADRRKNEFLAMLAHELRTPLASVCNAAEVLARQAALPDKTRWTVDVIRRQSDQLKHLVNDLLDVSRITHGRLQMRMQLVTVQEPLENALQSVASLIEERGHNLETRISEAPVVVMGDPVRLAQVFANLLSNAAKYTPDGGQIEVTLAQLEQTAVIRFRDSGMGIPIQDLPDLFTSFFRRAPKHRDIGDCDGLGLGLYLAQTLTQEHGGAVEARSDGPGQGSEFIVKLPAYSDVEIRSPFTEPMPAAEIPGRTRRILVVDDNLDVATSFKVLLETMGHHVRTLHTGTEVLEVMGGFRPEVVFLDIDMPDMDGYEIAMAIRAAKPDLTPFLVALTGRSQDYGPRAALEAGFDRHLSKPPSPAQIETLLEDLD